MMVQALAKGRSELGATVREAKQRRIRNRKPVITESRIFGDHWGALRLFQ
jgi:hypothetical protein